jgi:hypothetical protein
MLFGLPVASPVLATGMTRSDDRACGSVPGGSGSDCGPAAAPLALGACLAVAGSAFVAGLCLRYGFGHRCARQCDPKRHNLC